MEARGRRQLALVFVNGWWGSGRDPDVPRGLGVALNSGILPLSGFFGFGGSQKSHSRVIPFEMTLSTHSSDCLPLSSAHHQPGAAQSAFKCLVQPSQ